MYNVGSVFRTSDASRIEQLILCGMTAHPPRKEIDKTALGSVDSVPWVYYENTIDAIQRLKGDGISVVAVEHTDKSIDYRELNLAFPMAFIFGHEVYGINDEVLGVADHAIEIPMYGIKQSLNLAVSYGIVLYHFVHRYVDSQRV
jgi:tRNA G18 (ribose-2'-O)-methylase SpoU